MVESWLRIYYIVVELYWDLVRIVVVSSNIHLAVWCIGFVGAYDNSDSEHM